MHFIGPISVTWYDFIKKCLVKSVASKTSLIIALFWYEIAPVIVEIDYVLDNLEVSSFLKFLENGKLENCFGFICNIGTYLNLMQNGNKMQIYISSLVFTWIKKNSATATPLTFL